MQSNARPAYRSRLIDNPLLQGCDLWPQCCCDEDCKQERGEVDRYGPAVTCLIVAITSVAIGIAVLASIFMRHVQ